MRIVLTVLLIFIAHDIGQAQSNGNELHDGRFWRSSSDSGKLGYLVGYNEGVGRGLSNYTTDVRELEKGLRREWPDLTFGEMKEAVDRFYESPDNRLLPVVIAIRVVAMTFTGVAQPQIDALVDAARKQGSIRSSSN